MPVRQFSSKCATSRARYYLSEHGIEPTVVAAHAVHAKFALNHQNPPNVATLRALLAGNHPVLGFGLRPNRTIAGWEWSEGLPKTVSLCALIAPLLVRRAVKYAAQATVDFVARIISPHGIHGGRNETLLERVSEQPKWCTPCFATVHHYSRDTDPHEHVHFLLFNAIHDGKRWVGADVSGLFAFTRLISQFFHSSLALALSQDGIRLQKRALSHGVVVWEVEGFPRVGLNRFSRRTIAIQAASGSRKRRKFSTRPRKQNVNEETLRLRALSRLSLDQVRSLVRITTPSVSSSWPPPSETIRDIVGEDRGAGVHILKACDLLLQLFHNPGTCQNLQETIALIKNHASIRDLGYGLWSLGRDWIDLAGWLRAHVVNLNPELEVDSLTDVMRVRDVAIIELPSRPRKVPRSWDTDDERQRGIVRRQISRSIPCFEAIGSTLLRDLLGPEHKIYPLSDIGSHWEAVRTSAVVCLSLAADGLTPHLLKRLRFEPTRFLLVVPTAYKQVSEFGRYLIANFPVCRASHSKRELRSRVVTTLDPALKSGKIVTFLDALRQSASITPSGIDVDRVLRDHDNGKAPLVVCSTREKADRFISAFHTLLDRTAADRESPTKDAYEPDPSRWDTAGWFPAYVKQNIAGATRGSIVHIRSLHNDCAEIATITGALLPVLPREHFTRLLPLREASRKLRIAELIRFPVTFHTVKKERLSMHRPYRITGFIEENGHTLISLNGRYLISGTTPLTVPPCVCVFKPNLRWEADTMWLDFTAPELAAVGGVSFLQKTISKAKYGLHLCGDTLANYRNALLADKTRATEPDLSTLPQHGFEKAPSVIPRTTLGESLPER